MKPSHTSPEEAIQAFHDLNAKYFIPMHYGTYDISDEPMSEPMRLVKENLPAEKLFVPDLVPGAVYRL